MPTLLVFHFFLSLHAQNESWFQFTNGSHIMALGDENDFIWIGTGAGSLVRIDKKSLGTTFFNAVNSGIKANQVQSIAVDNNGKKWFGNVAGLTEYDDKVWINYNTENSGLPQYRVQAITIGKDGRIWTGTEDGLAVFDGSNWIVYKKSNSGLSHNMVTTLATDNDGKIWIGTEGGGLNSFDGQQWKVYNVSNSGITENKINALIVDKRNHVWAGTATKGLCRFDSEKWTIYNSANAPLSAGVWALSYDKVNDHIWASSTNAVARYDGNGWTKFIPDPFNFDGLVLKILAENGHVWVGTLSGGLYRFDGINWMRINVSNSAFLPKDVYAFDHDCNGNTWVGHRYGVAALSGERAINIFTNDKEGKAIGNVFALHIDKRDRKWLGTFQRGIMIIDGEQWTNYTKENSGLIDNYINDIKADLQDNKWIATYKGLSKFDGKSWTSFNMQNSGLPSDNVTDVTIDKNNVKWIGTDNGLASFNDRSWQIYNTSNSIIPTNRINDIIMDRTGVVWVTTSKGLIKILKGNMELYNTSNSEIASNGLYGMDTDRFNHLWIASEKGIIKFDGQHWTTFNQSNSKLPYNLITRIFVDIKDNKWISLGNGYQLIIFNENSIDHSPYPENTFNIFPNPVTSLLTLDIADHFCGGELYILSLDGKLVQSMIITDTNESLDLSNLSSGVYILCLKSKDSIISKKVMKR